MNLWHLAWIIPLGAVLVLVACGFVLARIVNYWMDHEG